MNSSRVNNFDLIRLLAAAQVAVVHICDHLNVQGGVFIRVLGLFPGVPIFFFVSGFLVSQSLSRADDLRNFYRNRVLRVYPALWGCLIVSVFLVALIKELPWTDGTFIAWLLAQATIGQFYNPDFLRDFGVGVVNGSLWTIPVELQFYIILPAVYAVVRRFGIKAACCIMSFALVEHSVFLTAIYGTGTFLAKLLQVTILPWLGFFMAGVLTAFYWDRIEYAFRGKLPAWIVFYITSVVVLPLFTPLDIAGNRINALSALLLFGVILSAAFTAPKLSGQLLRGNDISYGLYLYHMPLLNVYLAAGAPRSALGAILIFIGAILTALASWMLVERPALTLKSKAAGRIVVNAHAN